MTRPGDSGRQRSILPAALMVQSAVVVLALLLAWLTGLQPWKDSEYSIKAVAAAVAATVPLIAVFLFVPAGGHWLWARKMQAVATRLAALLFSGRIPGTILAVSVLAGVGEELLFRGVIQTWLGQQTSPALGLIAASVLFGLAHWVSRSYAVLTAVVGAYLGLLYHLSGNLFIPVVVHALYDWVALHYYLRRADRLA
ncbi:MAG TPA: CPBP family intramembrane glutamic endopeptidase [Wenzhouxiangella sp.]|nr:CPBP family intramembrane glutamic endopeptidase [Wenzhouxiangella sp.]